MDTNYDLNFNEISIGQEIPVLTKEIYKALPIIYSGALVSFIPIHIDNDAAKEAGLSGIILHGLCSLSFISQMLTDWCHDPGAIKELNARFQEAVQVGDTVFCKGKIVDKKVEGKIGRLICEVWAENQKGRVVVGEGLAILEMPLKK